MNYARHIAPRSTPQSEPLFGQNQVQNSAGGYVYALDAWKRLDRFLILGSEGGTYYVGEHELTRDNATVVNQCYAQDYRRTVQRIVDVSVAGRAPKNDPAIFALALGTTQANPEARKAAFEAMPAVCRTGTHLFQFAAACDALRGWGRGLRNAVATWYDGMPTGKLAYQAVKYRQRNGWTHRDLLRLAHPKAEGERNAIYNWIVKGWDAVSPKVPAYEGMRLVWAFESAQRAESEAEIVRLITDYHLPWEAVDNKWLKSATVWEALLPHMPLTALIRNLGRMTANGLIAPFSDATRTVVEKLADGEHLRASRVHPMAVLVALKTYAQGQGVKGSLKWNPERKIVDALDGAFYAAFGNVTPCNKRMVLGLDVSGSMSSPMMGSPLTCREAVAALALVTARTEPEYHLLAFSHTLVPVDISPRERLDDVLRKMDAIPMGNTDCALPMLWALGQQYQRDSYWDRGSRLVPTRTGFIKGVEGFIVLTDNETWFGATHPSAAINAYRQKAGLNSKLVVVGMTSTGFSIAPQDDSACLDVVGMDTATPQLISDFIADRL